jgi:DNA-binding response OmpR family regulator
MPGERILVVDDEPHIVQLARLYLEREGYQVETAGDGLAALKAVQRQQPALIVLDIMLPEMDGLEVCRRLQHESNPAAILMLTARDDDVDKILGLELGADDYLTKPFNPREMVARVRAILRRGRRAEEKAGASALIQIADLLIDPARFEVTIKGAAINLRHQEFNLLVALAEHQGLVLSREQLLRQAWGYEYFGESRTVDAHIGALRKKLSGSGVQIETIMGVGYKLVET